jgi:predicted nucleotidyltransferase
MTLQPEYQKDLDAAIAILKAEGCREIYLFGSLADGGTLHRSTDIDIAVRGLPRPRFFVIYGKLLSSLEHPVDLIDLDSGTPFARVLEGKGTLHRVA